MDHKDTRDTKGLEGESNPISLPLVSLVPWWFSLSRPRLA